MHGKQLGRFDVVAARFVSHKHDDGDDDEKVARNVYWLDLTYDVIRATEAWPNDGRGIASPTGIDSVEQSMPNGQTATNLRSTTAHDKMIRKQKSDKPNNNQASCLVHVVVLTIST